jgi:hypothetical protein
MQLRSGKVTNNVGTQRLSNRRRGKPTLYSLSASLLSGQGLSPRHRSRQRHSERRHGLLPLKRGTGIPLVPAIAYWCHWRRKFKKGPSWVSYSDGMQRLNKGFAISYNGVHYIFSGEDWRWGSKSMSIEEMERALSTAPRQWARSSGVEGMY